MAIEPGLREKLRKQRIADLPEDEREAMEKAPTDRSDAEKKLAEAAKEKITVKLEDVVEATDVKKRSKAIKLLQKYLDCAARYRVANQYKNVTINYGYWKNRAETEQTEQLQRVRKLLYDADKSFIDSDIPTAEKEFREAFALWREILDTHPELLEEETFVEDLKEDIDLYRELMGQVNEDGSRTLPEDFPLLDVMEITPGPGG
ncbi:MAG: hypothetical protein VXZ84_11465 [Planctomycetota bacterium]|nr:hypothetical protein [Planctomycetota bacterium]